jgi:hypothetical protein
MKKAVLARVSPSSTELETQTSFSGISAFTHAVLN